MKNEKYFVFCLFCIVYYFLAAFAWEYFLSILFTSLFWVALWYVSNKKFLAEIKARDEKIERSKRQLDAGEVIRKQLFVEYTGLNEKYKKNLEMIKVIRKSMVAHLGETDTEIKVNGLSVPQSKAAMKLEPDYNNKSVILDPGKYEQE